MENLVFTEHKKWYLKDGGMSINSDELSEIEYLGIATGHTLANYFSLHGNAILC